MLEPDSPEPAGALGAGLGQRLKVRRHRATLLQPQAPSTSHPRVWLKLRRRSRTPVQPQSLEGRYSVVIAFRTLSFDARRAGNQAARIPKTMAARTKMTSCPHGIDSWSIPSSRKAR
jgi:hypothetical protein